METTKETFAIDKFIQRLRDAQVEIEEFRVQLALGKAEAKDKFEELKHFLQKFIVEVENYFYQAGVLDADKKLNLQKAIDELKVQLNIGIADAKDMYAEQKKNIEKYLNEIETLIASDERVLEMKEKVLSEFEKAKIKLEILQLQFSLGKLEVKDEIHKYSKEVSQTIEDIESVLKSKSDDYTAKFENVQSELRKAYIHIKKAFAV